MQAAKSPHPVYPTARPFHAVDHGSMTSRIALYFRDRESPSAVGAT